MRDYQKLIDELEDALASALKLTDLKNYDAIIAITKPVAETIGILEAWKSFQDAEAKEMGKDNG